METWLWFQQHGSVYWKRGGNETVKNLDPSKFLHEELGFAFALPYAPVWMDSSTTEYCLQLEKHVGGPQVSEHQFVFADWLVQARASYKWLHVTNMRWQYYIGDLLHAATLPMLRWHELIISALTRTCVFVLQELSRLTGSRAYERFTGSQIAKIIHTKKEAYNATEVRVLIF